MTTNWYYAAENRQMGPIPEAELDSLAATGVIAPQTLVWREGMPSWRSYSTAKLTELPNLSDELPEVVGVCTQCKKAELQAEMVRFGATWVCANCKEIYTQRLREGILGQGIHYAGFWT